MGCLPARSDPFFRRLRAFRVICRSERATPPECPSEMIVTLLKRDRGPIAVLSAVSAGAPLMNDRTQAGGERMRPGSGDGQGGGVRVTLGVDTHADFHVGVALDQFGRRLGARSVATTAAGFAELLSWASALGVLDQVGIEGTGSYGAGLARWLRARGLTVVEVERPHRHGRQARRRRGKSDPYDAEAAARAVQAGAASGQPKAGDGRVEMIRALRLARRSAMKARTQAANQLHALVITAPDDLRPGCARCRWPSWSGSRRPSAPSGRGQPSLPRRRPRSWP
jgi:hypothetical protein